MANNHAAQHAAQAELDELVEKGELTENGYIRMSNLMKNIHTFDACARNDLLFQTKRNMYLAICLQEPHSFGAFTDINPCSYYILNEVFGPANEDLLLREQWVDAALGGYQNFIFQTSRSESSPQERRVLYLRFLEYLKGEMQHTVTGKLAEAGICPLCHFQREVGEVGPADGLTEECEQVQEFAIKLIRRAPAIIKNLNLCGCAHFQHNAQNLKKMAYSCAVFMRDESLQSDLGFVEAVGVRRSARLSNQ